MPVEEEHRVRCRLDELLTERSMTLTELSERVGVSVVNLSILKNNRAKAVRFTTLTAICDALACTPGELFVVEARPDEVARDGAAPLASLDGHPDVAPSS